MPAEAARIVAVASDDKQNFRTLGMMSRSTAAADRGQVSITLTLAAREWAALSRNAGLARNLQKGVQHGVSSRMRRRSHELHKLGSLGWLRASVLGANDGIVSTSSLILGVAAAHASHANVVLTGVAGLVAGAMSMATGEYVSVHSQADTE